MDRLHTAWIIVAAIGFAGCSPEPEPVVLGHLMQGIQGGQVDNDRSAVVGVRINRGGGQFGGCTGSLIAPNLVLTAQHCVAPSPSAIVCGQSRFGDPYGANQLSVTTNTQMPLQGNGLRSVREIRVVEQNANVCGSDMAVLILDENIPNNVAEPLVPRLDDPIQVDERYTAVGYGHIGNGSGSGTRRSRANLTVECGSGGCGRANGAQATEMLGSGGVCQGDSGGPPIDALNRVMGALSRGGPNCSSPIYSSTQGHQDWLLQMGQHAADLGGYEAPGWVNGEGVEPPPDTDGDGIRDSFDNCPNEPNPDQANVDHDEHGDACDDVDDRSRGGDCPVCDQCSNNQECGGAPYLCAGTNNGGICTRQCNNNGDCPGNTSCFQVNGGRVCLNSNANQIGVCGQGFVCMGDDPDEPDPVIIPDRGMDPEPEPDQGVVDVGQPDMQIIIREPDEFDMASVDVDAGGMDGAIADAGVDVALPTNDSGSGSQRPTRFVAQSGCAQGPAGGGWPLALLGLLMFRRRRDV